MSSPALRRTPAYVPWFIAAAACFVLPFFLLVVGLAVGSLTLVYASILLSAVFFPLLVVGIVQLVRAKG